MNDKMIDALLTERAGYERRGMKDRVAQVDKQLKEFGYASKTAPVEVAAVEPAAETAAAPKVRRKKI